MANSFEDVISQIKDRLDIVDVVSQYVVLKKSGANYWGLCPFHNESLLFLFYILSQVRSPIPRKLDTRNTPAVLHIANAVV